MHFCSRRCRNLYCKKCATQTAQILLYGIKDDAKVCERCFGELINENSYIRLHRPLLLRGESFNKPTMMGLQARVVELRLIGDMRTLIYDDVQQRSEPREISLKHIRKISVVGLTAFALKTHDKTYEFEADSSSTQKKWIDAIKMGVEVARYCI